MRTFIIVVTLIILFGNIVAFSGQVIGRLKESYDLKQLIRKELYMNDRILDSLNIIQDYNANIIFSGFLIVCLSVGLYFGITCL